MKNILDYINDNKNISFKDKRINDIDKTIFILLSYVDFLGIVPSDNKSISLDNAIYLFLKTKDKKKFNKRAPFNYRIYELIKLLENNNRYGDLKLSNYVYINNDIEQFSALTIRGKYFTFISFEGTEVSLVGWEEDLKMSYEYPIKAGIEAFNYVDNVVSYLDRNVYIGGHSKGGHLALVSLMNLNFLKRRCIKQVIGLDSPGLKEDEFNSKIFNNIKDKYYHLVPNYSIVGQLLYNGNSRVVKSKRIDIYAHLPLEWEINNDDFIDSKLSKFSNSFNSKFNKWLSKHSLDERKKVTEDIFDIFKKNNIKTINELIIPRNAIKILKETKKMDQETKDIIMSLIMRGDK